MTSSETTDTGTITEAAASGWQPDHFLDRYEVRTIDLGPDPDGEDPITAT